MNKIDTAASKGFRIASRLVGYIGLGLCLIIFILGYAMPKGFWIDSVQKMYIELPDGLSALEGWNRLDLAANQNKLIILAVVAGAILVIAILFRIISACSKTTVEDAVAEECGKVVEDTVKEISKKDKKDGKAAEKEEKKQGKVAAYLNEKAKKVIPEDKMPYVEKAQDFVKKYSTVILTSAATLAGVALLSSIRSNRRRNAERRKFLRNLL